MLTKNIKKRKIWIFPLPVFIAIIIVLLGGGVLIYALTRTAEDSGPVAYWKLDEGTGYKAYDVSGNGNDGVLTNFDFDTDSNWTSGKVAGALEFDGADDYVIKSVSDFQSNDNQGTITIWFKPDMAQEKILFSSSDQGTNTSYFRIYDSAINQIYLETQNAGGSVHRVYDTSNGEQAVVNNQWNFIAITSDGSTWYSSLNGVSLKAMTNSSGGNNGDWFADITLRDNIAIGAFIRLSPGLYFNGSIDEISIYDRALSSDEVQYIYNRGGPIGWWKFDEGTGSSTIAYDSSGNGFHGTIYGASTTQGKINSALSFDGTDDYVNFTQSELRPSAWTFECWYKTTGTSEMLANWYTSDSPLMIGVWSSNQILLYGSAGAPPTYAYFTGGDVTLSDGNWHHLAVSMPENSIAGVLGSTAYIDGQQMASSSSGGGTAVYDKITFNIGGSAATSSWHLDGAMDDVRLYNYVRDADEIRMDYNFGQAVRFGTGEYDLNRGLVGYWDLNEGAGDKAYDSSNNSNNGSLKNFDFNTDSDWIKGNEAANAGGALKFDGTNDYVDIGTDESLNFTDQFTVAAWVKFDKQAIDQTIFGSTDSDSARRIWFRSNSLSLGQDGNWTEIYPCGGAASSFSIDKWYHYVGTYDGSNIVAYIDGMVTATGTITTTLNDATYNYIGKWPTGNPTYGYMDGGIDEVRIYNRALSADEVRYLYNRREPVGWWKFDEGTGSGTVAYDSSINGNNGTIYGASTTQGKVNSALSFDTTDDYVQMATTSFNESAQTIEMWYNPGSTLSDSEVHVLYDGTYSLDWNDFETSEGVSLLASSGGYTTNEEGTSTEQYKGGNMSYKLDMEFSGTGYNYWGETISITINKPTYLSGWIYVDNVTNSVFYIGLSFTIYYPNSGTSATPSPFCSGVRGQWKYCRSVDLYNWGVDYGNTMGWDTSNIKFYQWVIHQAPYDTAHYVSYWDNISVTHGDEIIRGGDNNLYFIGGNAKLSVADSELNANEFNHIVGTYDTESLISNLYINGQLKDTDVASTSAKIPNTVRIGGLSTSTPNSEYSAEGIIDEVKVYNYARSAEEIRTDYNEGFAAKFGPSDSGGVDLERGLVGYWDFEEMSGGEAYDSSNEGNDGELMNFDFNSDSDWEKGNEAANTGGALRFDGSNDYVDIANASSLELEDLTAMFWFNTDDTMSSTSLSYMPVFFEKIGAWKLIYYYPGGFFIWYPDYPNNKYYRAYLDRTFTAGEWYHAAITWDNSAQECYFYIDGVPEWAGGDAPDVIATTTNNLIIGSSSTFDGKMDEFRLYNRVLSAEEVRYAYNRGAPVAHWKFDSGNGSGTLAYDSSINGNHGTIYGATSTAGKINRALEFDGTDDYINLGTDSSIFLSTAVTVEAWAYIDPSGDLNGNTDYIISVGYASGGGYALRFEDRGGAYPTNAIMFNVTGGPWIGTSENASVAGWYHIAGTYDKNLGGTEEMKLYINGVKTNSYDYGSPMGKGTRAYIGAYDAVGPPPTTSFWHGTIDDVRIYNYARTQEQILQDYNAGFSTYFE